MYEEYDNYHDHADDDSDLMNYCACCGHDFRDDKPHNDRACAASQE